MIKHQRTIYSSHFGLSNYSAHTHKHTYTNVRSRTATISLKLSPISCYWVRHVQVHARVMCEHTATAMVDEMFHPYNALPYISTRSAQHTKTHLELFETICHCPSYKQWALRPTNQRQRGTPNGYGKRTRIAASESERQTLNSHITKRTTIFQCNKAYLVP